MRWAAACAGLTWSVVRLWRSRGKSGEKPYAEFYAQSEQAVADGRNQLRSIVRKAAEKSPEHAKWLLTKRWPEDFAERKNIDAKLDVSGNFPAVKDELIEQLKKEAAELLDDGSDTDT